MKHAMIQAANHATFASNQCHVDDLGESEERLALVAEAATEGLYDWNIAGNSLYVSPRLNRMFGFEGGRFNSETWYIRVHPDEKDIYRQALTDLFRQKTNRLQVEYRMRNLADEYVWVRDNAVAQRDARGRAVRLVGAIADISESKEQQTKLQHISSHLAKYISPQVYVSILSGRQDVKVASQRKKLTVFFSDIEHFTETTESLESEDLTNLLNHYLTEMSKIALAHGATIDKYVGDAMMMFFGDPESRGVRQDALTCVQMAIAMQQRMAELQIEWLDLGLERPFRMRIGINTGYCTVGNFGCDERMDYTIIGNEVNLALRVQAHAEPGGILLAHGTHALVKNEIEAEQQDAIRLKGLRDPVRTYDVPIPAAAVGQHVDWTSVGVGGWSQDGVDSPEALIERRIRADLARLDKAAALSVLAAVQAQVERPNSAGNRADQKT